MYAENYTWKSTSIGADKLQVHPEDPNYVPGLYHIGVFGYKSDLNTFSVMYKQESIPESIHLSDSYSGTITDWKYFKIPIENAGESRLEILATPGIGYLEFYISHSLFFPNEEEHAWNSGVYTVDPCSDSDDPFKFDTQLDPDPYDKVLKKVYTRKPNERELVRLTRIESKTDDPIRFCIDTDDWKYSSLNCYLGVKNTQSDPINFKISKREVLEENLLTGEMAEKFEVFRSIFGKVEGSSISQNERKRLNCTGKSEFTYGEIDFVHMAPIFELCKPKNGEVFWDLGCGAGKCMGAMALQYPKLKKVAGVEFLDLLHESCQLSMEDLRNYTGAGLEVEVHHGDMLKVDWSDADILFTSSICFPNELIEGILEKSYLLKKGARFITLKSFPPNDIFEVKYSTRVKMTWGKTGIYVLEKVV